MTQIKISNLTELTSLDKADVVPVVDTSATTTKKVTAGNLKNYVLSEGYYTKEELDDAKNYKSVKEFGAVGDGSTNDTDAIVSAINSGETIFFPEGTYLLYQQIDMTSDIHFIGEGETSIIKLMPYDQTRPETYEGKTVYNCYMFAQTKGSNVGHSLKLENIVLNANKEGYNSDVLKNGSSRYDHTTCIDLYTPSDIYLDNVTITGGLIEGCYIYAPSGSVIINNCKFINNGYKQEDASGLHLEGTHTNTTVTNSIFNGNGFHGLLLAGNNMTVNNIHCENNGYTGLMLWGGASYNNVSNVYASGNECAVQLKSGYKPNRAETTWDSSWMTPAAGNNIANITDVSNTTGIVFGNCVDTKIVNWEQISDTYAYGFVWNMGADVTGIVTNYKLANTSIYNPSSSTTYDKIIFTENRLTTIETRVTTLEEVDTILTTTLGGE